jgi:hypothetical protein
MRMIQAYAELKAVAGKEGRRKRLPSIIKAELFARSRVKGVVKAR